MKNDNLLLKVREVLLKRGYTDQHSVGTYEIWMKNTCFVYIFVQASDRFEKTFLNITICKRGYSRVVVVFDRNRIGQFRQMLNIVESTEIKLSKEVLEGKTHFQF